MGRRSKGRKSLLLNLKLEILGALSYWLAGALGRVDKEYSQTFVERHGHKRLNELMAEEAEYWKDKYRADK
jgi:hypothetical protein